MRTSFHLRSAPCRWWLGVSCEVRPPSWARRSIPVPLNGPRLARWESGMMSVTLSMFWLGAGEFLYAYSAAVCVFFVVFNIVFIICRWIVSFVFTSVFLELFRNFCQCSHFRASWGMPSVKPHRLSFSRSSQFIQYVQEVQCHDYRPENDKRWQNQYGSVSKPCTPGEHQNSW